MFDKKINNSQKIKLILGVIYLGILFVFLYLFFSNFGPKEITSYEFIQSNREYLLNIKHNNIITLSLILFLFTIFWVLLLGFGSPIALFGGFIFGKWLGCLIVTFSLAVGATCLYIVAAYFFKDIIKNLFLKKFSFLADKFKEQALLIMIIYRLIGLVPFGIANLLPVLFNIKIKDYFLGTLIGIFPSIFIMTSLGSGIESIFNSNNELPNVLTVIKSSEIYIPIFAFIIMIIFSFFGKKFFIKFRSK